ncbi:MAG: hypothetical protein DRR42_23345, partial [Gammaproteobacteria bacterium]
MRFTTIAGKITFLVAGVSIFIALAGSYFVLQREYQSSRQQFLTHYQNLVTHTSHQYQLALHYRDYPSLEKLFDIYFKNKAIEYIAIYDTGGQLLIERERNVKTEIEPRFQHLIDFSESLF